MNAWIQCAATCLEHGVHVGSLLEVLLQSVAVLLAAGALCVVWRRAAAASKHLIWLLGMASLPLLLGLALAPHSGQKTLWSVSSGFNSGNQWMISLTFAPAARGQQPVSQAVALREAAPDTRRAGLKDSALTAHLNAFWAVLAAALWAAGVAFIFAMGLAGEAGLSRLARRATPLDDAEWGGLLKEACRTLRLRRWPTLWLAKENVMPLTWGWWRPRVLLPREALDWPVERRRIVLLHELAHVRRWDCLTQAITRAIVALFWVNPLVWVAARRMRVEREHACDDLVLSGGCKPSDYASQLLEIARAFRPAPQAAGLAMARSTRLQGRINGIIDASRARRLHPAGALTAFVFMGALVVCLAETTGAAKAGSAQSAELKRQQLAQLEAFARAKLEQSKALAAKAGETISPEYQQYFDAATQGDFTTVTNRFAYFKQHHPQYTSETNVDNRLRTAYWQPVLEVSLAYDVVLEGEPRYTKLLAEGIIDSIPAGSIYFGGTDPGRGLPAAFEPSSTTGEPFYCLTQNALADGTYLDYVRAMYGAKIHIPSAQDAQQCFQDYTEDAARRLEANQLKAGENVQKVNGQLSISGEVAVMSVNGRLAKRIIDQNTNCEVFVEESFPIDWMYPCLEPHGLIMKLDRQPLTQLSEEVLARDYDYWHRLVSGMIGDWLDNKTTLTELTNFVEQVHVRHDLSAFTGDPLFIGNDYSKKAFSKLRSSLAGVFAWRLNANTPARFQPQTKAERQRLSQAADLAFRQAFALCPSSPETAWRYATFLVQEKRLEEARQIAQTAAHAAPDNAQFQGLMHMLQKTKQP